MTRALIYLFTILLLSSCKKELVLKDYKNYLESTESGLTKKVLVEDIEFSAMYKPTPYSAYLNVRSKSINEDELRKEEAAINDMQYYTFRIKSLDGKTVPIKKNLSSESEYFMRMEYFSFSMKEDFALITETDTLFCLLHHYERSYDLSPYETFSLAFKASPSLGLGKRRLLFFDRVFSQKQYEFEFEEEAIKDIPKLKID